MVSCSALKRSKDYGASVIHAAHRVAKPKQNTKRWVFTPPVTQPFATHLLPQTPLVHATSVKFKARRQLWQEKEQNLAPISGVNENANSLWAGCRQRDIYKVHHIINFFAGHQKLISQGQSKIYVKLADIEACKSFMSQVSWNNIIILLTLDKFPRISNQKW